MGIVSGKEEQGNSAIEFHTFVAVVTGAALRTCLSAILALILIARAAHRKPTFMAGSEEFPFWSHSHVITADLADVAAHIAQLLCRLHNQNQTMALVSVGAANRHERCTPKSLLSTWVDRWAINSLYRLLGTIIHDSSLKTSPEDRSDPMHQIATSFEKEHID